MLIPGPAVGVAASRGAFAVLRKDGTVQCKGLACAWALDFRCRWAKK